MRPPRIELKNKRALDTSAAFFDQIYGWVKRLAKRCPKCGREHTMVLLEDQHFEGCTLCLYVELQEGYYFEEGDYSEAQRALDSILAERRVDRPFSARFQPMNFKRNGFR